MADHAYLSKPDILDAWVREDLRNAENGDPEAVRELHRELAEYLRVDKLTPFMRDLLAGMHESIAAGRPTEVAMLTKPLASRPVKTSRDMRIYASIADRLALIEYGIANRALLEKKLRRALPRRPTMNQLYADAAKQFDVSKGTAKRVYLKVHSTMPSE